jgi:branched-chain amino acid transport system permease protein
LGDWINTIVQGVMLGGVYAMFAIGLALIFGVMKLVNIAHGDLIVLSAYVALIVTNSLQINPLVSLVFVIPIMAVVGYLLQRGLFNRTLGADLMPPLLVSFGLSIILQNGFLWLFSADNKRLLAGGIETASVKFSEAVTIGVLPLLQFALAALVIAALQILLYRTSMGRAFRAVSDDPAIAELMGLNRRHVFGLAMGLSLAVVALAGVLLAIRDNFDPASGPTRLIFGFEAVVIGGLTSFWGTLAGGVILGVVQTVAGSIDPGFQVLAGHLAFLCVLAIKPSGLFGSPA